MARRGSVWRAAEWPSKQAYKKKHCYFRSVVSIKIKIKIHWLQFNSIRLNSNQDSCIQHCVVITICWFLESDVLLKYDLHNFGVRRDRSFISPYFGDLNELIFHTGNFRCESSTDNRGRVSCKQCMKSIAYAVCIACTAFPLPAFALLEVSVIDCYEQRQVKLYTKYLHQGILFCELIT